MGASELAHLRIDAYQFGRIEIDKKVYRKDIIITPAGVVPDWWRAKGHSLSLADLTKVIDEQPDVIIIGTGYYGRMQIPDGTRQGLEALGIELLVHPTRDACRFYNTLAGQSKVVAALHLTC